MKKQVTILGNNKMIIELPLDEINECIQVLNVFNLEIQKENDKLYVLVKDKGSLTDAIYKVNDIKLINGLENIFADTKFKIIRDEHMILLSYDNKKYINDNVFLDEVLAIARLYLCKDDLWKLETTYEK